jgi:hypothetical protein
MTVADSTMKRADVAARPRGTLPAGPTAIVLGVAWWPR